MLFNYTKCMVNYNLRFKPDLTNLSDEQTYKVDITFKREREREREEKWVKW